MTNQGTKYINYGFTPSKNHPGDYYVSVEDLTPEDHRLMYDVIFFKTPAGQQQKKCKDGELNIDGEGNLLAKCEQLYPYPEKRSRWYKR